VLFEFKLVVNGKRRRVVFFIFSFACFCKRMKGENSISFVFGAEIKRERKESF
jgi:hypothetical protein